MHVVSIVGARPQFVKAAALGKELRKYHRETLIHTGQHYDYDMSRVFFEQLNIPDPDINLNVGSGSHAVQTAQILMAVEKALLHSMPDAVIVYGDTNSTLAGTLAAVQLHIPVIHVEAGLRSFNRDMPEENNRMITDRISTLLLCPSATAAENLKREGITHGVHVVGDVMLDVLEWARDVAKNESGIFSRIKMNRGEYALLTVHRPSNTDDSVNLRSIVDAVNDLNMPMVFPVHPRTRKAIRSLGCEFGEHVKAIDPVGYVDMVMLESNAAMILTDSGGIQKEAYWLGVPCITLRMETEWVETVESGWNILTGPDKSRIIDAVSSFRPVRERPVLYGNGQSALECVRVISDSLNARQ